MIRLRPSGVDEVLIKRVQDWYEPGPGVFIQSLTTALFSPEMLFTGSTTGAWYDPSDFTTLFQDAVGTTPVTAVGQPVGLMLDKSGLGNHAFNSSGNSADFPVLQQDGTGRYYLAFNGVNQWLRSISSINFTNTAQMFVCAGVRKLSDPTEDALVALGGSSANNGFEVQPSGYFSSPKGFAIQSTGPNYSAGYVNSIVSPTTKVYSAGIDRSKTTAADTFFMRLNGVAQVLNYSAFTDPTGNFGNYPLYIGARAGSSLWFNGRLYQLVVAGKQASASEITNTETFINQKTGAY